MNVKTYEQIHMLTFPLCLMTNVYLYETQNELVLIDTALKICSNKIIQYIHSLKKPLTAIALTHAHDDHIGGLFRIHEAFPEAKIYIGENETEFFNTQCVKNKIPFDRLTYFPLAQNNVLHSLKIINTAGHTAGSISFYDSQNKSLICGDLFHSQGGLTISGNTKFLFPFPDIATQNLKNSITSAIELKSYSIEKMFCGHGKVTNHFYDQLDELIDNANSKIS